MSTSGIFVGQGQGVPNDFAVKAAEFALPLAMVSAAPAGTLLKFGSTAGTVDIAATSTTKVAGILGEKFVDPSTQDADLVANAFALGILKYRKVGEPATCWKRGWFRLTNVTGSVNYGDFVVPDTMTAGNVKSNSSNTITNGTMICVAGNSAANGPIEVYANLA